jgi:hypothetical protein
LGLSGSVVSDNTLSGTTTEHNEIEEGVGAEAVGTVDGCAGGFTSGVKTLDFYFATLFIDGKNLSSPVGGDTSHVVMDGGEYGDGLLGGVDTSENVSSLKDTRETFVESLWGQVVQMQVDVITIGSTTAAFKDFHGHGAGDDITGSKILDIGSIPLHEALTVFVTENTTFTTAALGHEAASSIDTRGVELDKLGVHNGEASTRDHAATITSAGVGGGATLVSTTISTSGNDSSVSAHTVNGAVSHVVSHNTTAFIAFHNEVKREVLHEEDAIVTESATKKSVKHAVTSAIGNCAAAVSLTALSVIDRLTTKSTLVDFAFSSAGEGHTIGLEFTNSNGRLTSHVLNCVLVSKPVTSLHGVVEVPSPVVLVHVAESSVDTSLSGHSVGAGREELGNASGLETSLGETKGSL